MAASNINRVLLTGNLCSDPELRTTGGGTSVCRMRVAVNGRRKSGDAWVDKVGYFNIVAFGKQGENAAKYLSRGKPVAIDGRLEWSEWTTKEGVKRQDVSIVADSVQFLGSPTDQPRTSSYEGHSPAQGSAGGGEGYGSFEGASPAPEATPEDEIPF